MSSPSNVKTLVETALHNLSAAAAIVSNTGFTSDLAPLMTRRISAVAFCCSRASSRRCSTLGAVARLRTLAPDLRGTTARGAGLARWLNEILHGIACAFGE